MCVRSLLCADPVAASTLRPPTSSPEYGLRLALLDRPGASMSSNVERRGVICLMLMLITSPRELNAAATTDHIITSSTISTTGTAAAAAANNEKSRELDEVLSSLEAAFRFMTDQAVSLNLDTIIGTRMVEGAHLFTYCSV